MKVSINWAQYYSNVDLKSIPTDELLTRIGEQLGAVEDVTDWSSRYDGIVVAHVKSVTKHPKADKLNLCMIDDGGITPNVKRSEQGLVQVVCGAPEVAPGMIVAWLTPGTTVPVTAADEEPFVLNTREIRGIESPGMLGTPHELDLNDDHSGLLNINPAEVGEASSTPGTPFKTLYGLDDVVIDCENKMFTHRPDCFGILGVARELAGITGHAFVSPDWYAKTPRFEQKPSTLPVRIYNDAPELTPRMMAVVIKDVAIKPSPIWMQAALHRVGIKSINNIVDITNFMMQLTGQPMHAFDYHKIADRSNGEGAVLGPRLAADKEPLTVLGGKKLTLTSEDVVLATDKEPADLAGVIGGGETEVDANTTAVLLTCASFDMYAVRRSTMRHGVFTDAAMRYTKGQSPLQNDRVLAYAMEQILKYAGGEQDGEVIDKKSYGDKVFGSEASIHDPVMVSPEFINVRLGLSLSAGEITKLLTNVEFDVDTVGQELEIHAPFWRTDIEIPEDIVEEVGRLYGYDKLPRDLPPRSLNATPKDPLFEMRSQIRDTLSRAGANETLTYSFVHSDLLIKAGQSPSDAFKLKNALSPDLQYYRLSLLPSLLDKVHANVKSGHDRFVLFELGKTHVLHAIDDAGIPIEYQRLGLVLTDNKPESSHGAPYYAGKAYVTHLLDTLGVDYTIEPIDFELTNVIDQIESSPYDLARTAYVRIADSVAGFVGELKPSVRKKFKLPDHTVGVDLDVAKLMQHMSDKSRYAPLSRYPGITQDVSLQVDSATTHAQIATIFADALFAVKPADVLTTVSTKDIYQGNEQTTRNVTFRVHAVSHERTLQTGGVNDMIESAVTSLQKTANIQRI
jgi:phenylalanyl-tRNA synthetase beta chain